MTGDDRQSSTCEEDLLRLRSRYSIYFGLNRTLAARRRHWDALRQLAHEDETWSELEFLHENLATLDGKAATLMQFDSILLAVLAVFSGWTTELNPVINGASSVILLLGILLSIISCGLCLFIVYAHWIRTETITCRRWQAHGLVLLWLRDRRTVLYRVAWWIGLAALGCLLLDVAVLIVKSSLA